MQPKITEYVDSLKKIEKKDFQETEIGRIPSEWAVLTLGETGNIITGTTPSTKSSEFYEGRYMFITTGDMGDKKYVTSTKKHLSEKGHQVSRPLPQDTILVVCIGATIGKTGMTYAESSTTNQQINAIIPEKVDSHYLYYAIRWRSPILQSLAIRAAIPIVNKSNFANLSVPIPPLNEQQKIAKVLSVIQRGFEEQDKIIRAAKNLKKSLMQKFFTEGLGHTEFEEIEIGRIPASWKKVKLREVTEKTKLTDPKKNPEKKFRYIDVSSISNEIFKIVEFKEYQGSKAPSRARKPIKINDIIFATIRPYLKRIAIVPEMLNGEICSTAFCVIRCKKDVVDPVFVFNYLLTDTFISRVSELQSGASYPAVTDKDVLNQKIPLPPLPEQEEIAYILSAVNKKIVAERKRKAALKELFKTTLHKLMTGEIRIKGH